MAIHLKIKSDSDNYVHFDGCMQGDYTLCGLETQGDEGSDTLGSFFIKPGKVVKQKVNCPHCISIANYCHTKIQITEYK